MTCPMNQRLLKFTLKKCISMMLLFLSPLCAFGNDCAQSASASGNIGSPFCLGGEAALPGQPKLVITPDAGKIYATDLRSGQILVISTTTDKVTSTIPLSGKATDLKISADGSKLFVATNSVQDKSRLVIIDTNTNRVESVITFRGPAAFGLGINQSKKEAYVTMQDSNTLRVLDTYRKTQVGLIRLDTEPVVSGLIVTRRLESQY